MRRRSRTRAPPSSIARAAARSAARPAIEGVVNGGKAWKDYNELFRDELLENQNEDGSWPAPDGDKYTKGTVMRTAFCTLMLEVYYRFLPGTGQNKS